MSTRTTPLKSTLRAALAGVASFDATPSRIRFTMKTMTRWLAAFALLLSALPSNAQPNIPSDFTTDATVSVDSGVLLPALDPQPSLFPHRQRHPGG